MTVDDWAFFRAPPRLSLPARDASQIDDLEAHGALGPDVELCGNFIYAFVRRGLDSLTAQIRLLRLSAAARIRRRAMRMRLAARRRHYRRQDREA